MTPSINRILMAFVAILFFSAPASAQWFTIRGFVYDSSRLYMLEGVSVLSTSGRGTATNGDGYYEIEVMEKDSIWFSYLNKPTVKFPVLKITNPLSFDVAILINVPVLKEVKVRPRNYRFDSIQNRRDYAGVFNYEKPKIKPLLTPGGFGAGVGIDLDELINMFRFKRNRSMQNFQKRLLEDEREKFIDHRFSKGLVTRLTRLSGPALDSFMRIFRPSYLFSQLAGDYDFQRYIRSSYFRFMAGLGPDPALKPQDEDF